jgi:hypothetical protein
MLQNQREAENSKKRTDTGDTQEREEAGNSSNRNRMRSRDGERSGKIATPKTQALTSFNRRTRSDRTLPPLLQ